MAGTCDYKNAGNFLTSCRTSWLLKKDSAPWSKEVSKYSYIITFNDIFRL